MWKTSVDTFDPNLNGDVVVKDGIQVTEVGGGGGLPEGTEQNQILLWSTGTNDWYVGYLSPFIFGLQGGYGRVNVKNVQIKAALQQGRALMLYDGLNTYPLVRKQANELYFGGFTGFDGQEAGYTEIEVSYSSEAADEQKYPGYIKTNTRLSVYTG